MRARTGVLAAVTALVLSATWAWPDPAPEPVRSAPPSAPALPPALPPVLPPGAPSAAPPGAVAAGPGHVDDYGAPVEVLIGHVDHLDLSRLPPDTRVALEAELARRGSRTTSLWQTYAPQLGRDPADLPVELAALDPSELAYLLLTVRAHRLAAAGAARDLAAATAATGPDHPSVTVDVVPGPAGGCVRVRSADDPYGRVHLGLPDDGSGPLADRLTRSARVGTQDAAGGCEGQAPAFTPAGLRALAVLG